MGRAAKFTSQQIIQAGLDIEKSGQDVSGFSIRNSLGGGAHGRIEEIWKQYVENRNKSSELRSSSQQPELAIEIQEMLTKTMEKITTQFEGLLAESCQISNISAKNNFELTLEASRKRITHLETVEQQATITLDRADIEIANLHGQVEKLKLANRELLESKHRQQGVIESLQQQIERYERQCLSSNQYQKEMVDNSGLTQILNAHGQPLKCTSPDLKRQ